jgi:hypothetical protein
MYLTVRYTDFLCWTPHTYQMTQNVTPFNTREFSKLWTSCCKAENIFLAPAPRSRKYELRLRMVLKNTLKYTGGNRIKFVIIHLNLQPPGSITDYSSKTTYTCLKKLRWPSQTKQTCGQVTMWQRNWVWLPCPEELIAAVLGGSTVGTWMKTFLGAFSKWFFSLLSVVRFTSDNYGKILVDLIL